ncbi:hypothetical protein, partial [Nonomuraea dietziae]|uniref:hypothetical protein n=1 Tax=Nonomuraea dietziae TaxID=65515 RepID=UPI0035E53DCB
MPPSAVLGCHVYRDFHHYTRLHPHVDERRVTSIERTAYPRFKRLITARELLVFFSPSGEEA